jgi:hypothetical protein
MITLPKKTAKMLCARAGIARADLTEEAQKIYDLFDDPSISPEQKEVVKTQLDEIIKFQEERVNKTTRRLKGESADLKGESAELKK